MISTDYIYYTDIYKGQIIPDETSFNSSAIEAAAYVDRITRGKADSLDVIPDGVNMAVCAVAEVVYREVNTDNVSSESVGNHSRTYANKSPIDREREKAKKAALYLSRTGLLYGGMS